MFGGGLKRLEAFRLVDNVTECVFDFVDAHLLFDDLCDVLGECSGVLVV